MEKHLICFVILVSNFYLSDFYCFNQREKIYIPSGLSRYYEYKRIDFWFMVNHCNDTNRANYYGDKSNIFLENVTTLNIEVGQFKSIPYVLRLSCQNLGIKFVSPGAFKYNNELQMIFLNNNSISIIANGIFNSLQNLFFLDISFNQIESIPDEVFIGTELEYLNLNNNRIKRMLSNTFLLSLNSRYLGLSFNKITAIDSDIAHIPLTNLTLNNNEINYINSSLLPNVLIKIDLSYNKILKIDNMLNTKWFEIVLRGNQISNFEINNETKILDVSDNKIQNISKSKTKINIEHLNLGNNNIQKVDEDTFLNMDKLESLSLNGNNISAIPNSLFNCLKNLTKLDLSNNNLSQISYGTFDQLDKLTLLNISHNQFKRLPQYQLHSLKKLQKFYFQNNDIMELNVEDFIKHLPSLREINFVENRNWICKNLIDFSHELKERNILFHYGNSVNFSNIHGINCQPEYDGVKYFQSTYLNNAFNDSEKSDFTKYLENLNKELKNMNEENKKLLDIFVNKLQEKQPNFEVANSPRQALNFSTISEKFIAALTNKEHAVPISDGAINFFIIMIITMTIILAILCYLSYLNTIKFRKSCIRPDELNMSRLLESAE